MATSAKAGCRTASADGSSLGRRAVSWTDGDTPDCTARTPWKHRNTEIPKNRKRDPVRGCVPPPSDNESNKRSIRGGVS